MTTSAEELPPPGFGTLRQDDFTIPLAWGPVQIKVTPLAEGVIRLAAPDTYQRLHGMVASRSEQIRQRAEMVGMRGEPTLFLVSFFTYEQQAPFDPSSLQLLSQGILHFQQGILPLTPEWGREQLKQQQTQSAIYLFDPTIDLQVPLEVQYADTRTRVWYQIIGTLQTEYGRVVSRAKG
ncbi:MAG: hypothetical protein AMS21_02480 [Gemmatimonas sp. SG8_38_2]|nr:MAG: hypothetical protein AMS21_02480 [Gemmatimonas sp. SG8_38_2]